MKKENFLIGAVIILFVLNILTLTYVLFGFHPFPPPQHEFLEKHGPEKIDHRITERLKLDDGQVKQFEELKTEHMMQVEGIQEASRKLHDEFFGLLKTEPVDTAKAKLLVQKIGENQTELDLVTFRHFEKMRGILREDQKVEFSKFLEEISRHPMGKHHMNNPPIGNPPMERPPR